ncbi:hypothetical protein T09_1962 [Trichinella sp. T9]|nr:hypothetical protein T09_1962 [Trichinella sp. T9]
MERARTSKIYSKLPETQILKTDISILISHVGGKNTEVHVMFWDVTNLHRYFICTCNGPLPRAGSFSSSTRL